MVELRSTRSRSKARDLSRSSDPNKTKRKIRDPPASPSKRRKIKAQVDTSEIDDAAAEGIPGPAEGESGSRSEESEEVLPASLAFSIQNAQDHLAKADPRFRRLFDEVQCGPFANIRTVDPFQTLATSIFGQQISFKAAKAIRQKFIRLYKPSLPEGSPGPEEEGVSFFPSAKAVSETSTATLRTAGLSARKADYVLDLATRFADGRLSAAKLAQASDDELYEMLIAVKGIGPWTVNMFSIFDLRRPNILPTTDLGVQKGLARWVLASHSGADAKKLKFATNRLPGTNVPETVNSAPEVTQEQEASSVIPVADGLPAPQAIVPDRADGSSPDRASTPLLLSTLQEGVHTIQPVPLPASLSLPSLRSRLSGKGPKKGLCLTQEEMQSLTESWAPYRSIGVWYMWGVIDANTK